MSQPVVFNPAVAPDLDDAIRHFNSRRPGLGDDFRAAFLAALPRIQSMPKMYPVVWKDVRRRLLTPQFPFGIFFILSDTHVEVIAVRDLRRDPAGWQSRV